MNQAVQDFVARVLRPVDVAGKDVLEVGSLDVNGSVRPHVASLGPRIYLGVDSCPGPRVDRVVDCCGLVETLGIDTFDVVISTEMLEHVYDWRSAVWNMVHVLRRNGVLVLTTRSPGFGFHAFPEDHWRYTERDVLQIARAAGLQYPVVAVDPDPGVFLLAYKPAWWTPFSPSVWNDIHPEPVPLPSAPS